MNELCRVEIESVSPGSRGNGGEKLPVRYTFSDTPWGEVLIASTVLGVCYLGFVVAGRERALEQIRHRFRGVQFQEGGDAFQRAALSVFEPNGTVPVVRLHLEGTPFQLSVWQALLAIPQGTLTSYGALAQAVGRPKAYRAVGTAVGENPVAVLIPCHRVVRASGMLGGYHWGVSLKEALISWERRLR